MGKMRKLKTYADFSVNEGLLLRDENIKSVLRRMADSDENRRRISELAALLVESPDKSEEILRAEGYGENVDKQVGFLKKVSAAVAKGDTSRLSVVITESDIVRQVALSKAGDLRSEIEGSGGKFTFGILRAIFKDARAAKVRQESKRAFWQILPRTIPMVLAPFYPVLAVIGLVFGSSRALNKIIKPVFSNIDAESKYVDFLLKFVNFYMKIPEGDVDIKDRFSRAFVVSDGIVDALKPEVVDDFSKFIISKMEQEPDDLEVPDHYIENELKTYLNDRFDIDPELGLKK